MGEPNTDSQKGEWANIFHAIGHPTMILDKDHKILMVNRVTSEMVKKSSEELIGKYCYEIFHKSSEPPEGCPFESMLSSGVLETNEMIMDAVGGTYLVSCTPVLDDAGELDRIIHIATDMSAKYRVEEELEAVLDIMAHDLRNRAQAALLGAEILNETCIGVESFDAIEAIKNSITSLGSIIEKVQSTRGFLNVPLSETILGNVLLQAIKILRYRYPRVQVNLNLEVQNAQVMVDAFLENLLLNILENGVIHNTSETKKIWVNLEKSGDDFLVTISDNGSGIPNYLLGGLFDSTRRFGGIGIQQSVRIAKKYGGKISYKQQVEPSESSGAEFTITIPSI